MSALDNVPPRHRDPAATYGQRVATLRELINCVEFLVSATEAHIEVNAGMAVDDGQMRSALDLMGQQLMVADSLCDELLDYRPAEPGEAAGGAEVSNGSGAGRARAKRGAKP